MYQVISSCQSKVQSFRLAKVFFHSISPNQSSCWVTQDLGRVTGTALAHFLSIRSLGKSLALLRDGVAMVLAIQENQKLLLLSDLGIIGWRPAGCMCTLNTLQANSTTVLVDKNKAIGALAIMLHIANYPSVKTQPILRVLQQQWEQWLPIPYVELLLLP